MPLQRQLNYRASQMIMYIKLFKINFTKMNPYEFKTFTDILATLLRFIQDSKEQRPWQKKK
ncbi:hypothetical protein DW025_14500 [Coprococcus sp. AF38-1]|nr:hypothetical protein DW025_14500 [Coprococcus sp. AF38-1]